MIRDLLFISVGKDFADELIEMGPLAPWFLL